MIKADAEEGKVIMLVHHLDQDDVYWYETPEGYQWDWDDRGWWEHPESGQRFSTQQLAEYSVKQEAAEVGGYEIG